MQGGHRFKQRYSTYMGDVKIFTKNEKELESLLKIFSQDIRIEFGIEKCAMFIMTKRESERQRQKEREREREREIKK